jgi:hypothetical protein
MCIKCCANFRKRTTENLTIIGQAFGEESTSRTRVFEWKRPKLTGNEKGETCEEQSQEQAHHFILHQGDYL